MNIEEFSKEDFIKLAFPIHLMEEGELVLEKFPRLKNVFKNIIIMDGDKVVDIDINKVIKYIIFVYDKGSPLLTKFESLVTRKVTGAALAGFDHTNEFEKEVELMMKCKLSSINNMIIGYCRLMRSRLFSLIVASNESFHNTLQELMNYKVSKEDVLGDNKQKMDLVERAKKTFDNIDSWSSELLSKDTNTDLQDTLYTIVDESDLQLSPEENSRGDEETD